MMHWRDMTDWQPGERRDEPRRLSIAGHDLRISVQRREVGDPWYMHCDVLGISGNHYLGVMTTRQARQEAVSFVQGKLERMLADVHQMKATV